MNSIQSFVCKNRSIKGSLWVCLIGLTSWATGCYFWEFLGVCLNIFLDFLPLLLLFSLFFWSSITLSTFAALMNLSSVWLIIIGLMFITDVSDSSFRLLVVNFLLILDPVMVIVSACESKQSITTPPSEFLSCYVSLYMLDLLEKSDNFVIFYIFRMYPIPFRFLLMIRWACLVFPKLFSFIILTLLAWDPSEKLSSSSISMILSSSE